MSASQGGRFPPGQSGNRKGRAPGSGTIGKLRVSIAERIPSIIEKLVMQAEGGDVQAAKLLLERVIAPLKAMEPAQPLKLPEGSATEQGRAVLAELSRGALAPGQAAALLSGVANLARVAELAELERRIEALEATTRTTAL